MDEQFDWPCHRRVAHAPHDDIDASRLTPAAYPAAMARSLDEPACPGVPAHPATMIGGADECARSEVDGE